MVDFLEHTLQCRSQLKLIVVETINTYKELIQDIEEQRNIYFQFQLIDIKVNCSYFHIFERHLFSDNQGT
jgi:hypothetical protein